MTLIPTAPEEASGQLPAPLAPTSLDEVEGWFFPVDQVLFDFFLARQRDLGEPGDLLEVGAYLGKSAIFLGSRMRDGDVFTICDLFDAPAGDAANSTEMRRSYPTLTRHSFEANYLSFHDELPRVIQGLSSQVREHVAERSCRFAHIDASHLYEHVRGDIEDARSLLHPHGVVALDDYRSEHTPGVAAATWQAVTTGGLNALCVTGNKLYGTWGDPEPLRADLVAFLCGRDDIWHAVDSVAGRPLVRIRGPKATIPAQPRSRHRAPDAADDAAGTAGGDTSGRTGGSTGWNTSGNTPGSTTGGAADKAAGRTAGTPERTTARTAPGTASGAPAKGPADSPVRPTAAARSRLRRLAVDLLPPLLTRALLRLRDARRDQA